MHCVCHVQMGLHDRVTHRLHLSHAANADSSPRASVSDSLRLQAWTPAALDNCRLWFQKFHFALKHSARRCLVNSPCLNFKNIIAQEKLLFPGACHARKPLIQQIPWLGKHVQVKAANLPKIPKEELTDRKQVLASCERDLRARELAAPYPELFP